MLAITVCCITFGVGRTTAEWFSTVVCETRSVVGVPVHVSQEEDPVGRRSRLCAGQHVMKAATFNTAIDRGLHFTNTR